MGSGMFAQLVTVSFAIMLVPFAALAADNEPEVRQSGGIVYVSGGIGHDQRESLEQISDRFNLKVTLATNDGHYLGGGGVVIDNSAGDNVLDIRANGPIFYARLEPGTYRVSVSPVDYEGGNQQREVTIGDGISVLRFTWEQ